MVYKYVCVTKKCLFCILLIMNRHQGLSTACFQDLYVAKEALDT